MPLYEYRCPECGDRAEILQKLGEGGAVLICRRCGNLGLERQLSTFAAGSSEGGSSTGIAGSAPASCTGFT